jgi:hypothetical protein
MSDSDYEAARERYEQACQGINNARLRQREVEREADAAEAELLAATRNLCQYESAPGRPLPQYRSAA